MSDKEAACHRLHKLTDGVSLCDDKALFDIDQQGRWFYQQEALPDKFCRLFTTILHGIDGHYYLITPVEKVRVEVEAYPLLIVDYELEQDGAFKVSTSIGTQYCVDNYQCFEIHEQDIFVLLARGLSAKLGRACYYRFIEQFLLDDDDIS
ncbi:DUF1285 domain-containing protein [Shewanella mesophila]|uniref:DUF1285 domain-containing protein n=1 Tax=Shewanella mesophila TaxID=2864208 RepID=UPI001C65D403|nr:DUF1285 domain-containing protein [Shewanella mesophila]QYJ84872.1 DUF1285 domain-containing protein [Shewanella mesophila]